MKLYINNKRYQFEYLEIEIDKYNLVRKFDFEYIFEKNNDLNIGDKVKVESEDGNILLEGKIDIIKSNINRLICTGRDNLGILSDCYIFEPVQFNKSTSLDTILKKICLDIKIIGSAPGLSKSGILIEPGNRISDTIIELSKLHGVHLIGNGIDSIEIDKKPSKGTFNFEYGKNLLYRSSGNASFEYYDKYTVLGLYEKDSYGTGDKHKVIETGVDLSKKECNNIAKFYYNINIGKNDMYICNLLLNEKIEINTKYAIKDIKLGINEDMLVSRLLYTESNKESRMTVFLERIL